MLYLDPVIRQMETRLDELLKPIRELRTQIRRAKNRSYVRVKRLAPEYLLSKAKARPPTKRAKARIAARRAAAAKLASGLVSENRRQSCSVTEIKTEIFGPQKAEGTLRNK